MLQIVIDWVVYSILGLSAESNAAKILNFFLYDSIKILILLFVMIFIVGFLRTYVSQERIRKQLSGRRAGIGNIFSALFGAVTPFCSCSSIPVFLSFLEAGVPLGVTFSFLITSPLINEYLVVLMFGFFGWKITLLYIVSGLLIGIIAGILLGTMNLEKYLVKDIFGNQRKSKASAKYKDLNERFNFGLNEAKSIVKKLWLWIIVGVGIGALIHNYVPEEAIHNILSQAGVAMVPIAILIGVPIYGSCAAIVPIAVVLFNKGVPLGTALAFMMATAALSLPEAVILRRALKLKLIAIFFGVVTMGILIIGYLFNFIQFLI
ncbi:permease [Candidatus Undinarchaeota archaeon]